MNNISEINIFLNGTIIGNSKLKIQGICDIEEGRENYISFILNKTYEKYLNLSRASALIVPESLVIPNKTNKTFIKVENPDKAFIKLLKFYNSKSSSIGISKKSIISKKSTLGKKCSIEDNVIIKDNVKIGNNVIIKSGTIIDQNSTIGDETFINSNVTINHDVIIGNRCYIESGVVLGSDGFGTVSYDGKHVRIPHIGKVILEDDILLGSNCTIDRGSFNDTVIGENTFIDNLVHIAHNVTIGNNCMIAGQCGFAGSAKIGNFVQIGGQTGIGGHIKISDYVKIAAKSGVIRDIPKNETVMGYPAINLNKYLKNYRKNMM